MKFSYIFEPEEKTFSKWLNTLVKKLKAEGVEDVSTFFDISPYIWECIVTPGISEEIPSHVIWQIYHVTTQRFWDLEPPPIPHTLELENSYYGACENG